MAATSKFIIGINNIYKLEAKKIILSLLISIISLNLSDQDTRTNLDNNKININNSNKNSTFK